MSGPTPFSQDGLPLFTEERPAVVILGDLLAYIQEMRQLYDDTQELYKVLQDNLSFIGSGSPKGVYASLSALQTAKPTGDTFIYVTTDNGNWYYWNGTAWVSGGVYQATQLADASILITKLAFPAIIGTTGKNLFNKATVLNDRYIAVNNGIPTLSAGYIASDYIQVSPDTFYTAKNTMIGGAFYDSNKTYVSGILSTSTFKTPSNASFIRISMLSSFKDTQQLEKGLYSTFYSSFENGVKKETLPMITKDLLDPVLVLNSFYGKNLFNKDTVTTGKYLNTNGTIGTNVNFSLGDFILVQPNTAYTIKNFFNVGLYDSNKVFISLQLTNNFTTPSNCYFVRVVTNNTNGNLESSQQLELGTLSTSYETFGVKIKKESVSDFPKIEEKITLIVAPSGGNFTSVKSALDSIVDASSSKRYTIFVKRGTYNETFRTKNYVDIQGEDKYKTIISYVGDVNTWNDTSTVFAESECKISNLTLIGTDTKYPLHIDKATGQWKCVIENVVMIHRGSLTDSTKAGTPLGIGLYQGQYLEIKNCQMIYDRTLTNAFGASGIYFHNQLDSVGTGYRSILIKECEIKGVTYGIRPNDIEGTGSTLQQNDAYIVNNIIRATHQEYYYPENSPSWRLFKTGNSYTQGL